MFKILSFKSSLRFSSWVILASFLSVPLSHAMEEEKKEQGIPSKAKNSPMEIDDLVGYINGFLPAERDQRAMSVVSKLFHRVVKNQAQKPHKLIKEGMQKLDKDNQSFIRKVFAHEVDCDKHSHFSVLKFINSFNKNPKNFSKYESIYQEILKYPELSKFHLRTMMVNADEFNLLESRELIKTYATFSVEQIDVLGMYVESLVPKLSFFFEYQELLKALKPFSAEQLNILGKFSRPLIPKRSFSSDHQVYLEVLKSFSVEKLDTFGRNAAVMCKNIEGYYHSRLLKLLSAFSVEKLDALGRNSEAIFKTIEGRYHSELLQKLVNFSGEQVDILGKYGRVLIQNIIFSPDSKEAFLALSRLSVRQLDTLGRNAPRIFKEGKGDKVIYYIRIYSKVQEPLEKKPLPKVSEVQKPSSIGNVAQKATSAKDPAVKKLTSGVPVSAPKVSAVGKPSSKSVSQKNTPNRTLVVQNPLPTKSLTVGKTGTSKTSDNMSVWR